MEFTLIEKALELTGLSRNFANTVMLGVLGIVVLRMRRDMTEVNAGAKLASLAAAQAATLQGALDNAYLVIDKNHTALSELQAQITAATTERLAWQQSLWDTMEKKLDTVYAKVRECEADKNQHVAGMAALEAEVAGLRTQLDTLHLERHESRRHA